MLQKLEADSQKTHEKPQSAPATYPDAEEGHVDLFLITSRSMLDTCIEKGYIADMTPYITSSVYADLKKTMGENFLDGSAHPGMESTTYYGLANTQLLGSYRYMLVDKETAADYQFYYESDFTDWASTETLRQWLIRDGVMTAPAEGAIPSDGPVCQVTGSYTDRRTYEEQGYYVYVLENPTVTYDDLCSSMFAISSTCLYPDRAFSILYYLNTDSSFHSTLVYGQEGLQYNVTDGLLTKIPGSVEYELDNRYTGSIFTLYPCTDKGQTAETVADMWAHVNDTIIQSGEEPETPATGTDGDQTGGESGATDTGTDTGTDTDSEPSA